MTPPSSRRLAYEEPDDLAHMTRDAVLTKSEGHMVRATSRLATARKVVEAAPNLLLQAAPQPVRRTAVTVSDTAAKLAAKLFD